MAEPTALTPAQLSRRHRRRPSSLRQDYSQRKRSALWLETHLWHAKRMHMQTMWGYRLPVHRCDKSLRASCRFVKRACTVHDASYYSCIELSGLPTVVIDALNHHINPTLRAETVVPQRERSCMFADCAGPTRTTLGPVRVLFSGSAVALATKAKPLQAWLWVHPSFASDVEAALRSTAARMPGLSVNALKQDLLRFELSGPECHRVLHHAFQVDAAQTSPEQLQAWQSLAHHDNPAAFTPRSVFAVSILDPRLRPPRKLPAYSASTLPSNLTAAAKVR